MPVLTEELTRIKGHRWQISCMGFSPKGSMLASGGWDKEVNVWDLSNLEVVHNLKGVHKVPVTTVSWHRPNGLLICTGSADHTAALWNAETGRHMSTLYEHFGWVLGSCFSATGSFLATASWDKTVRIWDPGSSSLINNLNGHQAGVWSVDFHPRSSTLCSASEDGTAKIWDARTNRIVKTLSGGHSEAVYCAKWSHDGAMIATGSADTKICIWEPGSGTLINTIYGHVDTVKNVAFNPNTLNTSVPVLASAGDFTVRLSDPRPDQQADILTLYPHALGKEVEAVAISPDGSLLVSGGRDGMIVLMNLFVPSVMPRSESSFSTSSVLRRSRVVRDRSYIYDLTSGDDEIIEEEHELEAEMEAEELDMILAEPPRSKRPEKQPSFRRLKRRSRFAEKEAELPDYATVRRKGPTAREARGKRYKEKTVDIPTMVAHLSAAIRAYGPEEPSSSSESDEEGENEELKNEQQDPVDVALRVIAFSSPEFVDPVQKQSTRKLSVDVGKLSDRRELYEKQVHLGEQAGEEIEEEYLDQFDALMPRERNSGQLDESLNFDAQSLLHASGHYTLGSPEHRGSSLQGSSQQGFLTSSPIHETVPERKRQSFTPILPPAPEYDEDLYYEDILSGEEYGDEVPLSEI